MGGDGACELWPCVGTWLNRACNNRAGRALVTPTSVMDPDTWPAYVAHQIERHLLGSVWPSMVLSSQCMLRRYVNDQETSMFWLAVDAETLALGDTNNMSKHSNDTEQTWKGRLAWTIRTNTLQNSATQTHLGRQALEAWPAARADICTSDPIGQVAHYV